jgi:hypothetical protein
MTPETSSALMSVHGLIRLPEADEEFGGGFAVDVPPQAERVATMQAATRARRGANRAI